LKSGCKCNPNIHLYGSLMNFFVACQRQAVDPVLFGYHRIDFLHE
jgi:hypothetical protein